VTQDGSRAISVATQRLLCITERGHWKNDRSEARESTVDDLPCEYISYRGQTCVPYKFPEVKVLHLWTDLRPPKARAKVLSAMRKPPHPKLKQRNVSLSTALHKLQLPVQV
jgi:hypothetical protein